MCGALLLVGAFHVWPRWSKAAYAARPPKTTRDELAVPEIKQHMNVANQVVMRAATRMATMALERSRSRQVDGVVSPTSQTSLHATRLSFSGALPPESAPRTSATVVVSP